MIETEQRVLDMFTREFTKRNDLGREYFEGDSSAMLIAMHNFMAFRLSQGKPDKIKAHLFKNPADDQVPRPTCTYLDPDVAISNFIKEKHPNFKDGIQLASLDLYAVFLEHIKTSNLKIGTIKHQAFVNRICHLFGAKTKMGSDAQREILFPMTGETLRAAKAAIQNNINALVKSDNSDCDIAKINWFYALLKPESLPFSFPLLRAHKLF
jgi:hypothetical protein